MGGYFSSPSAETVKAGLRDKPVVVVIGGGSAGIAAATQLESVANVVLLERRDHLYHHIVAPRAAVDSSLAPKMAVPYTRLLKYGHFVQGEVTEIRPEGIRINNPGFAGLIKYDYLVIATGFGNTFPQYVPITHAKDVQAPFEKTEKAVEQAEKILIIGGGAVGVELLGEISAKYPGKKITLVHAHKELITGPFVPAFKSKVLAKAEELATVITEDRVIIDDSLKTEARFLPGRRTVKTEKGQEIETDLVFFCVGGRPNTNFLSQVFPGKVDNLGQIKVNQYLQVEGLENVFAAGDITNVPETKQGIHARGQGATVASNIKALIAGTPLKDHALGMVGMFVTLGPNHGVGQIFGWVVGDGVVSNVKGKTFFIGMAWTQMKFKKPAETIDAESFKFAVDDQDIERLAHELKISKSEASTLLAGNPAVQVDAL